MLPKGNGQLFISLTCSADLGIIAAVDTKGCPPEGAPCAFLAEKL